MIGKTLKPMMTLAVWLVLGAAAMADNPNTSNSDASSVAGGNEVKFVDLSLRLNTHKTVGGIGFLAKLSEDSELLQVTCDIDPEALIFIVRSDEQILLVSQLFSRDDVLPGQKDKIDSTLLGLSPVVPLSSIGLQANNYILFRGLPITTSFESIVHEITVQAKNFGDVLESLESYLNVSVEGE